MVAIWRTQSDGSELMQTTLEELPPSEADHELIKADLAVIDTFDERITQLTA